MFKHLTRSQVKETGRLLQASVLSFYKKIHYLTVEIDLGIKVTRNVAKYPLLYVTYSGTKFEGAQWLRGRVVDSRPRVRASPASLRCILEQEY